MVLHWSSCCNFSLMYGYKAKYASVMLDAFKDHCAQNYADIIGLRRSIGVVKADVRADIITQTLICSSGYSHDSQRFKINALEVNSKLGRQDSHCK